jgi:hypothetical protein
MLARMVIEVNQFGGGLDGAEGGFFHSGRFACKGQNRAVVVEIGRAVKESRAFDRGYGGNDLVDHFGSPCFGKIGNAFD